jgi:hypothetical protein
METDVINIDSEVLSGSPVFVGTRVEASSSLQLGLYVDLVQVSTCAPKLALDCV